MPTPVKIEPPWIGVDLDRNTVRGTGGKHLFNIDVVAWAAQQ